MYSKRIKKIASLIDKGVDVIDVGCDHALLDIYLTKYNDNNCLASDINKKAIECAKKNIIENHVNIDTIVSSGLDSINTIKYNTCVIAGMGTSTILEILANEKANLIKNYIIQTNNDYYTLRKYMTNKGYYIKDEIALKDKKIQYIIIKFVKGQKKYQEIDYQLGPILRKKIDLDTNEYFKEIYVKNKEILKNIPKKYIFKRNKLKQINNKIKKLI